MAPDNYLVHLHRHTWSDNTIPELSTGRNNYIKTYRPDNCNTLANTDDDLIDITYTSYSYSNEGLLQRCEMNGPLLDHIQVVGFLDGPRCIQNQLCSSSRTATSSLPLSHNCTKNGTNYINLVNCNSMKRVSHYVPIYDNSV
jgi:hypothetical protein